jgi:hypothetical protein
VCIAGRQGTRQTVDAQRTRDRLKKLLGKFARPTSATRIEKFIKKLEPD